MNYKKIFKWIFVQVALLIILISTIEVISFLKLNYGVNNDCISFDLPLKAIPYQKDNLLGYTNPADTVIHLHSLQSATAPEDHSAAAANIG